MYGPSDLSSFLFLPPCLSQQTVSDVDRRNGISSIHGQPTTSRADAASAIQTSESFPVFLINCTSQDDSTALRYTAGSNLATKPSAAVNSMSQRVLLANLVEKEKETSEARSLRVVKRSIADVRATVVALELQAADEAITNAAIESTGARRERIIGDGNCLLRSVAESITTELRLSGLDASSREIQVTNHHELRRAVCVVYRYLADNPAVPSVSLNYGEDYAATAVALTPFGSYESITETTQMVLSWLLNRPIFIFTVRQKENGNSARGYFATTLKYTPLQAAECLGLPIRDSESLSRITLAHRQAHPPHYDLVVPRTPT